MLKGAWLTAEGWQRFFVTELPRREGGIPGAFLPAWLELQVWRSPWGCFPSLLRKVCRRGVPGAGSREDPHTKHTSARALAGAGRFSPLTSPKCPWATPAPGGASSSLPRLRSQRPLRGRRRPLAGAALRRGEKPPEGAGVRGAT